MHCIPGGTGRGSKPTTCLLYVGPSRRASCSLGSTPCSDCQVPSLWVAQMGCPWGLHGAPGVARIIRHFCVWAMASSDSEKIFGLVPSTTGAWSNCGLVDRRSAGLPNSRDGVLGQFVTNCASPLRPLDISEPGLSGYKMESVKGTYWGLIQWHMCYCASRVIGETKKAKSVMWVWNNSNWTDTLQKSKLHLCTFHIFFWHQLLPGANIWKETNAERNCSIWSPRANISSVWLDDFPHLLHSNILCQLPVFPQHFLWKVVAVGHDQTWERRSETPFYMLHVPISVLSVLTWPMTFKPMIKLYTFLLQ